MKFPLLILCALAGNVVLGQATLKKDSIEIRSAITNFYKWYINNFKTVEAFKLYQGSSGKDGPPYYINWKEAERYFSYLRKNAPFTGESFIASERIFLQSADSIFKKNPTDEIPAGFDYDRFTQSQEEPKWFWRELNKKGIIHWVIDSDGITARATIYESEGVLSERRGWWKVFCVEMKKEKGIWKIAKFGCEQEE